MAMADSGQLAEGGGGRSARRSRVSRRRVLYIGGFDPASPRKYHGIFSAEAPKQAALSGSVIEVGALEERGELASGWTVDARRRGVRVRVDYEVLRWNDIVRRVWPKDGAGLFVGVWTSLAAYRRGGVLAVGRRDAPVVTLTALMPAIWSSAFLIVYAALLVAAALLAEKAAAAIGWPPWKGLAAPALLLLAFFPAWRWADRFINVAWLTRGMICMVQAARGGYPDLDDRCEAFARRLIEADRAGDADEILVVGHSMGAQLAGQVVGKALRDDPELGRRGARLNLLTLGQLIPFYSLLNSDAAYRRELTQLVEARHVGWLDFTSPADAGSAAAIHPLEGVMAEPPADRPIRRSPRFHALIGKDAYRSLRRRPLDYHFTYLRAMDAPGDYDFFGLVAGPDFLTPQDPPDA
jgi:hypothetical protein